MKNGKKFAKTTKRIGRKVGNLAVWMQGLSIIAVVAICIAMSYRLTIKFIAAAMCKCNENAVL